MVVGIRMRTKIRIALVLRKSRFVSRMGWACTAEGTESSFLLFDVLSEPGLFLILGSALDFEMCIFWGESIAIIRFSKAFICTKMLRLI